MIKKLILKYPLSFTVILALLIGLVITLCGCKEYSKWQWRAGHILYGNKSTHNCVERTSILAKEMSEAGETFYICTGTYCLESHRWIEWVNPKTGKREILDPSVISDSPDLYKKTWELRVCPEKKKLGE